MLKFRIRQSSSSVVVEVPAGSTVGDVRAIVASQLGLAGVALLVGFPPKPLGVADSTPVAGVPGLESGCSITVKAGAAPSPAPSPSPAPVPAQRSCPVCTFINDAGASVCAICSSPLGPPAATPAPTPAPAPCPVASAPLTASSGGVTMRQHCVPADNDCLFTAVGYLMGDTADASELRTTCAGLVLSDPGTYTAAVLDRAPEAYAVYITGAEKRWGGAIELGVLAKHYDVTLVAVDIETEKQFTFGSAPRRAFLLYSGTHYDALEGGDGTRLFGAATHAAALQASLAIAHEAHSRSMFTNVHTFDLRCLVCYEGVVGQAGAVEHAKNTGHQSFGEYKGTGK